MKPNTCWLIEDNPADAELFSMSMKDSPLVDEFVWYENARAAMTALDEGQRPSLIILDLNMPEISGHTFLDHVKSSELSHIPVIVWTSSKAHQDIARSYELHANCCLTKPTDFAEMTRFASTFRSFWFDLVVLP